MSQFHAWWFTEYDIYLYSIILFEKILREEHNFSFIALGKTFVCLLAVDEVLRLSSFPSNFCIYAWVFFLELVGL